MKTNYFTDAEFEHSYTAESRGISNKMTPAIKAKWRAFRSDILNPLREDWGSALIVTSGYRCSALNSLVGGSKTSAHLRGEAIDLVPKNGDTTGFFEFTKWWLLRKEKRFDQLIWENDGENWWVHIGYRNNLGFQRGEIKSLKKV